MLYDKKGLLWGIMATDGLAGVLVAGLASIAVQCNIEESIQRSVDKSRARLTTL